MLSLLALGAVVSEKSPVGAGGGNRRARWSAGQQCSPTHPVREKHVVPWVSGNTSLSSQFGCLPSSQSSDHHPRFRSDDKTHSGLLIHFGKQGLQAGFGYKLSEEKFLTLLLQISQPHCISNRTAYSPPAAADSLVMLLLQSAPPLVQETHLSPLLHARTALQPLSSLHCPSCPYHPHQHIHLAQ